MRFSDIKAALADVIATDPDPTHRAGASRALAILAGRKPAPPAAKRSAPRSPAPVPHAPALPALSAQDQQALDRAFGAEHELPALSAEVRGKVLQLSVFEIGGAQ
jgi:hypothetical protein